MLPAVAAALVVLLAVGVWQVWAGRLSAVGGRRQLLTEDVSFLTPTDFEDPHRLLDRETMTNVLTVQFELVILVLAAVVAVVVVRHPAVPLAYKALVFATFLVGSYLLGRGLYIRLGLPVPGAEPGDEATVESVHDRLATALDPSLADDFTAVSEAMATARSDDGLDLVTVLLLAGARNGASLDDLAETSSRAGLASHATVRDRASTLREAGLLVAGDHLHLAHEGLHGASADELGTVAQSLLARS